MEISTKTVKDVTVVEMQGELDGKTSAEAQEKVLPLAQAGGRILLDMRGVAYMSSAGLRLLLSLYRQVTGKNGKIVLVGVKEEIRDTMSVTGFLKFFVIHGTVEEGVAALGG